MPLKGAGLIYAVVGGLTLYSGIKGATIADTVSAVLHGNLTVSDTEQVQFGSGGASGSSTTGSAILSDAEEYNGHKYVYGGPSNPTGGWDCSSFVSYVLGHDLGLGIPGGTWVSATSNGSSHGPTAAEYLSWSAATTVATSSVQPGDLLCWQTHVGFAVDANNMFSAYDTAVGTAQTPWTGPSGEGSAVVRRLQATIATTGGGTGGSSSNSTSANQALAKTIIQANSAYSGWDTGQNWTDLVNLWTRESNWSATAKNPTSGAYGIPQALPASKMGAAANPPTSDPTAQITWGLSYIKSQYGSPVLAWAHESANGWY